MKSLICLLSLVVFQTITLASDPAWWEKKHTQFVYFAVFEGLMEDGIDNEIINALLENDPKTNESLFVNFCSLCDATHDAMRTYSNRPPFKSSKKVTAFKTSNSEEMKKQIETTSGKAALLSKLTSDYIRRRIDLLKLTDAQKEMLEEQLIVERKNGMAYLENPQEKKRHAIKKTCPSCDAAVAGAAKPKRQ